MKVNRLELLQQLEAVGPGLSNREMTEQSASFAFKGGEVFTFNDEVSCRAKSMLDESFVGAVQSGMLLKLLHKLPDDEVEITAEDGHFVVGGKRKRGGLLMSSEITMEIGEVERPADDSWSKLSPRFPEAVKTVQQCAGTDESKFFLTCVHITPGYVEAFDNLQMSRYRVKTRIKKETLLRRDSLKHIVDLGITEVAETENWVHFRNPTGLVLSCRRYLDPYRNLDAFLVPPDDAKPAVLPKSLADAAERAAVILDEEGSKFVEVQLKQGRLKISSVSDSGYYTELKAVRYKGREMTFLVAPHLLVELMKDRTQCDCVVSPDRLIVDNGVFHYVTCLKRKESQNGKHTEEDGEGP